MKTGAQKWTVLIVISVSIILVLSGCGGGIKPTDKDTPTTGRIKIGVDNSYSLLAGAEIYTFESLYKYAKIDTMSGPEADVINSFMRDSIPMMIVSRKLTADEEKVLKSQQIYPKTTLVAYDAVAFIVNKENPDSTLFYDKIEQVFRGKITSWKQIDPKSTLTEFKVVFDNFKSGNTRFFREKFSLEKQGINRGHQRQLGQRQTGYCFSFIFEPDQSGSHQPSGGQ